MNKISMQEFLTETNYTRSVEDAVDTIILIFVPRQVKRHLLSGKGLNLDQFKDVFGFMPPSKLQPIWNPMDLVPFMSVNDDVPINPQFDSSSESKASSSHQ